MYVCMCIILCMYTLYVCVRACMYLWMEGFACLHQRARSFIVTYIIQPQGCMYMYYVNMGISIGMACFYISTRKCTYASM